MLDFKVEEVDLVLFTTMKLPRGLCLAVICCIVHVVAAKRCKRPEGPPQGIIGGQNAQRGQFPWMVWLFHQTKMTQCGASILSPTHILTAAHCVLNKTMDGFEDVNNLFAFAGIINTNSRFDNGTQQAGIKMILRHPKYMMEYHIYEMVILKLTKSFEWTQFVKPIRYGNESDKNEFVGDEMVASGWGNTESYGPGGKPSNDLKYATLVGTECKSLAELIVEDTFCARGRDGENVCSGDSGGPIVCKDAAGKDYLCGYSSKSHCEKGYGTLGRVNYYADFIRKSLKI